jgi:hypothetical protein
MPTAGKRPLRAAVGMAGVPRLIAAGPPAEWRLGELTVVIGAKRAEVRYAREPVGSSRPTPDAIVEAVQRARERLAARSREPDELLPALAAAYAAVLARDCGRTGDRVPLVELRGELTERLRASMRGVGSTDGDAGYTRAQFAWDLARLRRERRLVVGGRRIDLGVAAGHQAERRARVVWIENDGGGGSYFQSFRLIREEARS